MPTASGSRHRLSFAAKQARRGRLVLRDARQRRSAAGSQAACAGSRRAETGADAAGAVACAEEPICDLLVLALEEWWRDDQLTDAATAYAPAMPGSSASAQRGVCGRPGTWRMTAAGAAWRPLPADQTAERSGARLYLQIRLLKRETALSNPLLDFDQLLFCKRAQPSYSHLVGQYFGWRQRPGGGLFVLEKVGRLARRPRPRRPATAAGQLSGAASLLRRPAHRVLLRGLPAAAARFHGPAGQRTRRRERLFPHLRDRRGRHRPAPTHARAATTT